MISPKKLLNQLKGFEYYLITAVITLIITYFIYELSNVDLHLPFYYYGDEHFNYVLAKNIVDNGWILNNKFLGTPGIGQLYDFPLGTENIHLIIIKFITFFTDNHFLIINVFFIIGFVLISTASLFTVRKFNLSYPVAILISLLFAFIPYHFFRGTHHLFLSSYFVVPLQILIILKVINNNEIFTFVKGSGGFFRIRNLFVIALIYIISSGGIYYAFFTCFLLFIAILYKLLYIKRFKTIVEPILILAMIVFFIIINNLPTILYHSRFGDNPEVGLRVPGETEILGLKTIQLLLPVANHRIPYLAKLREDYNINMPNINENSSASLGIFGSIGFLFLLSVAVFKITSVYKPFDSLLKKLSVLNLASFIFGTVGGLGTVFSFIISPSIRSQNRISVFIAFFSLFAIGIVLEFVYKKIKNKYIYFSILFFLLLVGVLDQATKSIIIRQGNYINKFTSDKSFINKIEQSLPSNSKVFQLPYFPFPENGPIHNLPDYDHYIGYFHSTNVKWSYGGIKGREASLWQKRTASLPPQQMLLKLKSNGFNGIYIDRRGYVDNASKMESDFSRILGEEPVISDYGNLSFFDLNNEALDTISLKSNSDKIALFNSLNQNGVSAWYLGEGWFDQTTNETWSNGKNSSILIDIKNPTKDLVLTANLAPMLRSQIVDISINKSKLGQWIVEKEGLYSINIPSAFLNKDINIINFYLPNSTSPKELNINEDTRTVAIGVKFLQLKEK